MAQLGEGWNKTGSPLEVFQGPVIRGREEVGGEGRGGGGGRGLRSLKVSD